MLVNTAGGQFAAPTTAISTRGFGAALDPNLTATAFLTQAARRAFAAAGGRVGTLSLTRSLAEQWAADGIRLFRLAPGTVYTAGVAGEVRTQALDAGRAGK